MRSNQLRSGIYLSYVSLFITNITNLILTPFIIKSLGQSDYGLYMLIGAFVGYIAILDFGLGDTTTRYIAKYRAERDKKGEESFIFTTFIIYILISLVVLIVGIILFFNLEIIFGESLSIREFEIAKTMFVILVFNLALTLPLNLFKGIISGYERFTFPRILTITRTVLRAIFIVIFLTVGYNAVAIVLIDATMNIALMLIYILFVYLKLNVKIQFHVIKMKTLKEILSYSSLIFISVIVDQIYWRIGHLVLGVVASTNEVAIFAIGIVLGQYFITFSTAISGVFLPRITKMIVKKASGEDLTNILIKTGRLQFLVLGLVLGLFILFGHKFVLLWAGQGYSTSWIVALLVMIPLIIVLTQTIGISILQAKNLHGFRAIAYLFISIINTMISIYMSRRYGAVGAAMGTTLSLVLGNIIVMNLYYHYKVKINIQRFYNEIFGLILSLIGSLGIGSLLLIFSNTSWLVLILQCVLFCLIYFVIMWVFGMNNFEKLLLKRELFKLRIQKKVTN
jgi:O-antigen/teichoic acid export membrane protein